MIAYGLGGECFKEFLEAHTSLLFSSKPPCLKAIALLDSSHRNDGITQESVRRFLRQRSVNWIPHCEDSSISEDMMGCLCLSVDRESIDEMMATNRASIIPVVKDAIFRFLNFCVDVDAGVGDTGVYYSDRWVAMEGQVGWTT